MDFLLMDIKKFLRKLENGQIEIEVGQWELHKDIENMNDAVNELMALKEEVENITINSAEQMELIKELQKRLDALDQFCVNSDSCLPNEEVSSKAQSADGTCTKSPVITKSATENDEISEISCVDSKSECVQTVSRSNEGGQCTKEEVNKFSRIFTQKKKPSRNMELLKNQQKSKCTKRTTTNEILERYLKDSAKYLKRKISRSTKKSHRISRPFTHEKTKKSVSQSTTLSNPHRSRARPQEKIEKCGAQKKKAIEKKPVMKPLHCQKCTKQFKCRSDFLKHEKKHRKSVVAGYCKTCGKGFGSKERLKEHEAVHVAVASQKNFKGFKCSYCDKICSSPEKLTAHLRQCRIIKKTYRG